MTKYHVGGCYYRSLGAAIEAIRNGVESHAVDEDGNQYIACYPATGQGPYMVGCVLKDGSFVSRNFTAYAPVGAPRPR